ncbi:protein TAPT1 homolog isoform X2 [Octopus vulgaris]|uniref:Protein TAPT1 homolog isoform X2 n=2 Tax=Octopus TaxID=6643 RepID=A0AA36BUJ0_OCTVU|nr:uncharacterized protein LOC115224435 isoform X2 [Octopus sinensis]CAI9740836.1 protein TAPT1 homolog isoform X2 [Octopus vulgaris]
MPPRPNFQAHKMNAFVGHLPSTNIMTQIPKNNNIKTHPSVRIKGTETNFNPVMCLDLSCSNQNPHMHCPFCVKSESYQDPVILKVHYRVKHVDKGIEFAGLKILRCCDHCDIVGIIKGEKKFKRAHWHCYKCRNGFNRRDEAIKHYKTHFRNPQTTFQIQIAQEVTQASNAGAEDQAATHTISQEEVSIHPVLTEAAILSSPNTDEQNTYVSRTSNNILSNGKSPDRAVHVSVAANETVDTTDSQTIMIIKEDITDINNSFTTQIVSNDDVTIFNNKLSEKEYALLQDKYDQLALDKAQQEQDFKAEIEQLKLQIELLNKELSNYQKREQELINQLCPPAEKTVAELIEQMEVQHRNLLNQHLAQLRSTYLSNLPSHLTDTTIVTTSTTSSQSDTLLTSSAVADDGCEQEQQVESEEYETASSLRQHHQSHVAVEVDSAESLEQHQQEHIAYLTDNVVARIQTAHSHSGQVHDDIVIITSSEDPTDQNEPNESGGMESEPLIICASTMDEAVSCSTNNEAENNEATVIDPQQEQLSTEEEKSGSKADTATEVQVVSIIHAPSKNDIPVNQPKPPFEPPNKRLRTET